MKKILFVCLIALGMIFTSCTSTEYCISSKGLQDQMEFAAIDFGNLGFELSGKESNYQNNLYVSGTSYTGAGYGTMLDNDYVYKDTYTFKDENGNSVKFTVQYSVVCDGGICRVQVCDCETNKSELYNKLCRNEKLLKINNLPSDYGYSIDHSGEVVLFVAGAIALATGVIIVMF